MNSGMHQIERAIGPVYQAIDENNHKKASKLVEAVLRRHPRSQLVRALKAYVAAQLGKKELALQLMNEIVEEGPNDERILHTMMFVYKAIGVDGLLDAYKSAVEKQPNEPGIRIGLFGAYVRRLEYISQQRESLKLAKLDPANADMFVWWSICSLIMQYVSSNDKEQGAKLLQLAYSMAERQERLKDKMSYEKFLVMSELLCGLGRHADAVARGVRFDAVCTESIPASEKSALVGSLHVRAGEFGVASVVYLESVGRDPQDWVAWHMYLATMLPELVEEPAGLPLGGRIDGGIVEMWDRVHLKTRWGEASEAGGCEGSVEARLERVRDAFRGLQGRFGSDPRARRSLALAGLEVAKYEFLHSQSQEVLCDAILKAVPDLSVYSSFRADLRGYLACLDAANRQRVAAEGRIGCVQVADELKAACAGETSSVATERKAFVAVINGYMLQMETGTVFSPASELIKLYFDHVHLVKDYDPKDRGLGEELLVLAVASMLAASVQDNVSVPDKLAVPTALQLGLVFIQAAQQERRVSAPLRLAASAIYGLLGADSLAAAEFAALDIKGVLHDSLTGHWIIPMLAAACPNDETYETWFKGIQNLHTVQAQEARDALVTVYEEQTYSKVPEFVDFIKCLDTSNTLYVYKSEAGIASCRKACLSGAPIETLDDENIPLVEEIIHNDDLTVRPFWYPPGLDGPLFEVHGWWEQLYRNQLPFSSDGGMCEAWWILQHPPTLVPSGQRATWELTLNQQLALRLEFPGILARVCSMNSETPEDATTVSTWINTALEAAGMSNPAVADDPHGMTIKVTKLLASDLTETLDVSSVAYLRALTVLVGYQLATLDDVDAPLEHLAEGVRAMHDRCAAALQTKPHAGIPFVSRVASEEYVWITQLLFSYADDRAPMASIAAVVKTMTDSIDSLGAALDALDTTNQIRETIEQGEHALADCMHYTQGYDVAKCLAKLAEAQTKTHARIQDALKRVHNKLKQLLPV